MQTQDTASSQGPASKTGEFAYLDQEEFRRRHVDPAHPSRMFFHVEGVHCTSCLYRIENLKNEMPDVANVRLDMSRHVVEVETAPGAPFSRFAAKLKAMGYTPHPLSWESAQASEYARLFEWLSFALFLPVLLYSAIPFYSNSWAAFRSRRSSIDVPIVGALVFGTGIGLYHLIVGAGDEYFDSLAVLVFLLLSSRYLLFRLQDRFLAPAHLRAFYETNRVRVRNADTGALEQRHIDTISRGDEVVVYRGERVPVDGPLQSEEAFVNAAVLTGEALPQRLLKNQRVFAGTMLTSAEAIVRVDKVGDDTRVGMLLRETERGVLSKTPLISFADRVAQWFSGSVLVLGLVFAVIYSFVDVQEAINRALALVILACPCALALAIPLTQSLALKKAARRGCLIKKAEAFEKLCQVREAFFDKTGTLTKGELDLKGWWPKAPDEPERSVIYALETHSSHPIAHLLAAELSAADPALRLDDRTEIAGVGVAGRFQSNLYES
jgi:Cu+-exporting ATPase